MYTTTMNCKVEEKSLLMRRRGAASDFERKMCSKCKYEVGEYTISRIPYNAASRPTVIDKDQPIKSLGSMRYRPQDCI